MATFNIPQGTRQGSRTRKASQLGEIPATAAGGASAAAEDDEDDVSFEVLRRSAGKLDRRRHRGHEGPMASEPKGFA